MVSSLNQHFQASLTPLSKSISYKSHALHKQTNVKKCQECKLVSSEKKEETNSTSITAHKEKYLAIETRRIKKIVFLKYCTSRKINKKQDKHFKPSAIVDLEYQEVH